ncbi:unnamed protein product [Rotaria magnacalcarata]
MSIVIYFARLLLLNRRKNRAKKANKENENAIPQTDNQCDNSSMKMDNNLNEVKYGVVADAEKCIHLSGDALGSNQHEAVDIVLSDVSNKNTNISCLRKIQTSLQIWKQV